DDVTQEIRCGGGRRRGGHARRGKGLTTQRSILPRMAGDPARTARGFRCRASGSTLRAIMDIVPLQLARIQFAAGLGFHVLFLSIALALAWLLLFFKWRARHGDA